MLATKLIIFTKISLSFTCRYLYSGEKEFEKHIVYGNYVLLSYRRWIFLQKQVREHKPHIPFYVCETTSPMTDKVDGRMVIKNFYLLFISQIITNERHAINFISLIFLFSVLLTRLQWECLELLFAWRRTKIYLCHQRVVARFNWSQDRDGQG